MKTLAFCLLIVFATASISRAQVVESPLNSDFAFRQALNSVQYPLLVEPLKEAAKVYVNFTINKEGKIESVDLLKMGSFSNAFKGEVTRIFANLPIQKSDYAGEYVLPVVFEPKSKSGRYQPTVSDRASFDRTFVQLLHSKVLLKELYVSAK